MSKKIASTYLRVLQVSTVFLTAALFWFAFVYYPKIVADLKGGKGFVSGLILKPVAASSYQLPIRTSTYRIEYQEKEQRYYVFISGKTIQQYSFNKDNARLTLKSAASVTDLCELDVIYISSDGLNIPNRSSNSC